MSDRSLSTNVPTDKLADATHLKVSVFYNKGGINYFTYKTEPGGYWASVRPITVEVGERFTSEKFMMFGDDRGFKVFLGPAARFNRKMLDRLAATILPQAEVLAGLLAEGNKPAVAAALRVGAMVVLPPAVAA